MKNLKIEFDIQIYTRIIMERDEDLVVSTLTSKEVNQQIYDNIYIPIEQEYNNNLHCIRDRKDQFVRR